MTDKNKDGTQEAYTRREAIAAMVKYSAAVGGSATAIVTAEGIVSTASAYPAFLQSFCQRNPTHWLCTWDGWSEWENRNGNRRGGRSGRVRF